MFSMILRTFWRRARRHSGYTLLNVSGLALGLCAALLLGLHVQREASWDRHYPKANRIARVTHETVSADHHWATTSVPLAQRIEERIAGVERTVRLRHTGELVLLTTDRKPRIGLEAQGLFADPAMVDVFDLSFLAGDPESALEDPESIVLTRSLAHRLFGDEPALGRELYLPQWDGPMTVSGVVEDPPLTTHLEYELLVPMGVFTGMIEHSQMAQLLDDPTWGALYTYVLLDSRRALDRAARVLEQPAFHTDYHRTSPGDPTGGIYHLQPITSIHLGPTLEEELAPGGSLTYVVVFALIALMILVISGVNFVNTALALSLKRSRETGLRRVVGAGRWQIAVMEFGDTLMHVLVAAVFALGLFELAAPLYARLTGFPVSVGDIFSSRGLPLFAGTLLMLTLFAGLYPALFVGRMNAVEAIRGVADPTSRISRLRQGLLVLQVAISTFLIFSAIVVGRQLADFRVRELGFDRDQIAAVTLHGHRLSTEDASGEALRGVVASVPGTGATAVSSSLLGERLSVEELRMADRAEDQPSIAGRVLRSSPGVVDALGLTLHEGRGFRTEGNRLEMLVNRAAARELGPQTPVGRELVDVTFGLRGTVVGVVEDFHYASLHHRIEPLVILSNGQWANYLLVKLGGEDVERTFARLKDTLVREAGPNIEVVFADRELNRRYAGDRRMQRLFTAGSAFAVFISCLGLFAMASLQAQQRVREIGIRKVLGAGARDIVFAFGGRFVGLVLIAGLVALPLGALAMNHWLQGFAYSIGLPIWALPLTLAVVLVVTLAAIGWQAARLARLRPAKTLRTE